MSTITAVCPSCGKRFQAPEQFAGKKVKCKGCGVAFRIGGESPAAPAAGAAAAKKQKQLSGSQRGDHVEIDDSLAQLESVASFTDEDTPAAPTSAQKSRAGSGAGRIGPKLEKKIAANPDAEEIDLQGPSDVTYRANVMHFRYPGAKAIDQWMPLFLLVVGFVLLGIVTSHQDVQNVTWIAILRFAIPMMLYYVLIFPITMAMIRKAGQEMRYQMPPGTKLRGFAAYMPAFAFTVAFWMAGGGGIFGLVLGAFLGLAMSSAALWLLFRLREEELPTSIGYGAGGFTIGLGIAVAIVLGLNLLTGVVLAQLKAQAKVPASPFGPGLAWATPSPADTVAHVTPKPHQPAPSAPANGSSIVSTKPPLIDSPVFSDFHGTAILIPGDNRDSLATSFVQPIGGSPVIAIVRPDNGQILVQAWDLSTTQRVGSDFRVNNNKVGNLAISTDGQRVAWIATFPRRSIQLASFTDPNKATTIDLDLTRSDMPALIGFCGPDRVLLQWGTDPSSPMLEVVNVDTHTRVCRFTPLRLQGQHPLMAVCPATQRLLVASRVRDIPTLVQYDLNTGSAILYTKVSDLDPMLPVDPRGLAYSNDGKRMAVYFEDKSGAGLLVGFDTNGSQTPVSLTYPQGPTIIPHITDSFEANALASLDPSPLWLLYGDAVIDAKTNDVLANLGINKLVAQRHLDDDRLQLITSEGGGQMQLKVATIDRAKVQALLAPPTTQQAANQ
jgi:hypothetical protein